MTKLSIFLNTWKNYRINGAEGGEWVELPSDNLEAIMNRLATKMGDDNPKWFVNDTDWSTEALCYIGVGTDVLELNATMARFKNLEPNEQLQVAAMLQADVVNTIEEAIDALPEYAFWPNATLYDVAEEFAETLLEGVDKTVAKYFDVWAYSQDLGLDMFETSYGVLNG